jgi:outer membrane protein assembly factor BamB
MRVLKLRVLPVLALVAFFAFQVAAQSADWPQWRGPNRDGVSKETGLLKSWPANGPTLLWKARGAGSGYSSFAVANGKLFTMGLRGDREFIIAFDVANGKELWASSHGGGPFRNDRGDGPRGTPTVDGDRLYALGGNGDLSCLDARNGKIIWSKNVLKEFGGSNIRWGISESPLVIGD